MTLSCTANSGSWTTWWGAGSATRTSFGSDKTLPTPTGVGDSTLRGNPLICRHQALTQRRIGFPAQNLAQARIVTVPAAHALWPSQVVALRNLLARYVGDKIDEFVDADQLV